MKKFFHQGNRSGQSFPSEKLKVHTMLALKRILQNKIHYEYKNIKNLEILEISFGHKGINQLLTAIKIISYCNLPDVVVTIPATIHTCLPSFQPSCAIDITSKETPMKARRNSTKAKFISI